MLTLLEVFLLTLLTERRVPRFALKVATVLIFIISSSALPAAIVDWNGTTDSNWAIESNWSSGEIPGTSVADIAILSGAGDAVTIANPLVTDFTYSVELIDEASLTIASDGFNFVDILLGATGGSGGGHVNQAIGTDYTITVNDDIRIGDSLTVSSESSYRIGGGNLTVGDQLYVDYGSLTVTGTDATISANRMNLSERSTLKFDCDVYGVSPIVLSDQLVINSGAKLEIDLRGYTTGPYTIELIKFTSISGAFDSADITITGLNGGVVSYDSDSLNLTMNNETAAKESTLWFICGADDSAADSANLQVATGRRVRDLSSSELVYSQSTDGDDLIYSVNWSGSDFDGNGSKDTISFDLRVEAFSGSAVSYAETTDGSGEVVVDASMTALGIGSTISTNASSWGVGSDEDLDEGESLRFSVENFTTSIISAATAFDGFVSLSLTEPNGGNSHVLVVGEGSDLEYISSNFPFSLGISPVPQAVVTSATSSKVATSNITLKFIVGALLDTMGTESNDYSTIPTGNSYRDEYLAETDFSSYPAWSWDVVQRWAGSHNGNLDPDYVEGMASNHQIVGVENTWSDGGFELASAIKAVEPTTKTIFYRNTSIHFPYYDAGLAYNDKWNSTSLDEAYNEVEDMIRTYNEYNHSYPELRDWWVDVAVTAANHPSIDGLFIDKANDRGYRLLNKDGTIGPSEDQLESYYRLSNEVPEGSLIIGNTLRNERLGGNRELMHVFQGSYLERWELPYGDSIVAQSVADARVASIQLMREAAVKGKILMPAFDDMIDRTELRNYLNEGREEELKRRIKDQVHHELAYYLIIAEKYSYFRYEPEKGGGYPLYVNDPTDLVDELRHPLGAPLGPPVKNGYVYTRSFEHVDVWVNVETDEAVLTWDWKPLADDQTVETYEGQATIIIPTGSDPNGVDLTYSVITGPANGTITGTAPYWIYTPDVDFFGADTLTFVSHNETAESLVATISIEVSSTGPTRYIIGSDDFDGNSEYLSRTFSSTSNSGTSVFGVYQRNELSSSQILDTSLFLADGITMGDGVDVDGFLESTKVDSFLAVERAGSNSLTYSFDITDYDMLELELDLASGNNFSSTMTIDAQIDSGSSEQIFAIQRNTANWTPAMEAGNTANSIPNTAEIFANNLSSGFVIDEWSTHSASITGEGSILTITVTQPGSYSGAIGIDNLKLLGADSVSPMDGYDSWISTYSVPAGQESAESNPDGDSLDNYQEYLAGLNPLLHDDFAFTEIEYAGELTLQWEHLSGRIYKIYWTEDLGSDWKLLGVDTRSGSITFPVHPTEEKGFYKMTVELNE